KITNSKTITKNKITIFIILIIVTIISKFIKNKYGFIYYIICLVLLLGLAISKVFKNNVGYSILFTIISLIINYILFLIAATISFIPNIIFNIKSNFISLLSIMLVYTILIYLF